MLHCMILDDMQQASSTIVAPSRINNHRDVLLARHLFIHPARTLSAFQPSSHPVIQRAIYRYPASYPSNQQSNNPSIDPSSSRPPKKPLPPSHSSTKPPLCSPHFPPSTFHPQVSTPPLSTRPPPFFKPSPSSSRKLQTEPHEQRQHQSYITKLLLPCAILTSINPKPIRRGTRARHRLLDCCQ